MSLRKYCLNLSIMIYRLYTSLWGTLCCGLFFCISFVLIQNVVSVQIHAKIQDDRPVGTKGQCNMSYNLNIITTTEFFAYKVPVLIILNISYSPVILVHHQLHDVIMNPCFSGCQLMWGMSLFSHHFFIYKYYEWIIIDLKTTHTVLGYIN